MGILLGWIRNIELEKVIELYRIDMRYLVDEKNKIIFGWSPKCACSHIKKIFWYFKLNDPLIKIEDIRIHTNRDRMRLPKYIENYRIILFCRNPYKRLVSGFLDKYSVKSEFRKLWKYPKLTFSLFVDELMKNNFEWIDKHHFIPQTSEDFNEQILSRAKSTLIIDIENINYAFIEGFYNGKKIPNDFLVFKGAHARKTYEEEISEKVYDLDIDTYYEYNVPMTCFYNKELKEKVRGFYDKDFEFFRKNGIDYEWKDLGF